MATFKIRAATITPAADLAPDLPRLVEVNSGPLSLQISSADDLSETAKDALYKLYDRNMASILKGSSASYTEADKREELFDPSTRFLLLTSGPSNPSSPTSPTFETLKMPGALPKSKAAPKSKLKTDRKGKNRAMVDFDEDGLKGYCSFRFDTEETLGSRDVEVVYCYELQLDSALRGQGMGKVLMDLLETIGRERGMAKSMLTCMKNNEAALKFYTKQGYQPDEIDPTRMAEEESEAEDEDDDWQEVGSDGEPVTRDEDDEVVDYVILSRNLHSGP